MDVLIIAGHFHPDYKDTLRHVDDFRLTAEGIPLNLPNLADYIKNGRRFAPQVVPQRLLAAARHPYRQIYWSGLHLYDLLLRNGFEVALLNCHDPSDPSRLALYRERPACVVISTTFLNNQALATIVADLREHLPTAWIVTGGCHIQHSLQVLQHQDNPLYQPPELRNEYIFTRSPPIPGIDAHIVDTHGENTLVSLLDLVIRQGQRPTTHPNTVIPLDDGAGWRVNPLQPEQYDINAHRIAWSRVPRRYLASVVPFQTTYGCPFKCGFCNFSLTKVHKKSMDGLFAELRELAQHPFVERVWFTDDNFFLTERMVVEFCNRFIAEELPFSWASFIRASSITPRSVELLRKSRCGLLILGLESGSQTVLDAMGKKDTVPHYLEATSLLIAHGIDLEISFILGYPGETTATVDESIEFVRRLPTNPEQITYLYLFKFNLVPLSPVYEQAERERWQLDGHRDQWRHRTMHSDEVQGQLHRFAQAADNTVFNYLDPASRLERRDLVHLMHLRDSVARARLRSGENSPETSAAWDRLEHQVRTKLL